VAASGSSNTRIFVRASSSAATAGLSTFMRHVKALAALPGSGPGTRHRSAPIGFDDVAGTSPKRSSSRRCEPRSSISRPRHVDWNVSLTTTIAHVSARDRKLLHVPFAIRAGEEPPSGLRIPVAPDNRPGGDCSRGGRQTSSNTDAVDTFRLPLVSSRPYSARGPDPRSQEGPREGSLRSRYQLVFREGASDQKGGAFYAVPHAAIAIPDRSPGTPPLRAGTSTART